MSNCYDCKNRKEIAGSCHSKCGAILEDFKITQKAILNPQENASPLDLTLHENGVKNNWCAFPINFDPVWLKGECNKFEKE